MAKLDQTRSPRERAHTLGNFIAVDGESTTDPVTGDHRYVLIGASNGKTITRANGISTSDSLDFLLKLRRANPTATFVAFFFSYDVSMILKDLTHIQLIKLHKDGYVKWKHYKISNTMRKFFTVKDLEDNASVRINDTSGFFQCSFVKALEAWKVGSPALIADMKSRRSLFTKTDIPAMRNYCVMECELLVTLVRALEESLNEAGIKPAGWYGAGCIASGILRQNGIKQYRKLDTELEERVQDALLRAYFGGRVETFYVGPFVSAYSHDVRSAYPHAIRSLPTSHGVWRRVYDIPRYGVCRVRWNLPDRFNIGPFPHRQNRKIFYPKNGCGFYHAIEVRAAMAKYGDYIQLEYAYGFEPDDSGTTPFSFVPKLYEQRAIAKREGRASQLSLKLGLNSLYGKMAQGYGYKGSVPPYRTYFWAGQITATTRSQILQLMVGEDESNFIGFATDGVMMKTRANVKEGDELGQWEVSKWDSLFVLQPGMYHGSSEGATITKTRGFAPRELDWQAIANGFRKYGPYYQHRIRTHRFIGIGSAIQRANLDLRGTWIDEDRTINLYPQRKFVTHEYPLGHEFTQAVPFDIPFSDRFNHCSEPYVPKGGMFNELVEAKNMFENLHEQPRSPFGAEVC